MLPTAKMRQASLDWFSSLEICAGGGGQALGLEQAGFDHVALVEIEHIACETLRRNRPHWNVLCQDLHDFDGRAFRHCVDLLAGGIPCPPFSVAGKQLGKADDRDLFPVVIRLADEIQPKALMIENVRGLLDPVFGEYRERISHDLERLGYSCGWRLLNASRFGVPQSRPRVFLVGLCPELSRSFDWPTPLPKRLPSVGKVLEELMASRGWEDAAKWARRARGISPTIVGGSAKHGGPDLGPTRARQTWAKLGVDGLGIADDPPSPGFTGMPRLTLRMAARLQGFPDDWEFAGRKTAAYRQVGNALPPPLARAVGTSLIEAFRRSAMIPRRLSPKPDRRGPVPVREQL